MNETCLFCEVKEICRYYIGIGQRVHGLGLPHSLSKDIHAFLRVNLPKHCDHYTEMSLLEGDRDELGRLLDRKPLKLWYPNQEVTDTCRYCNHDKSHHTQGIWCRGYNMVTMYEKQREVREAPSICHGGPWKSAFFMAKEEERKINILKHEQTTYFRTPR